MNPHSTYHPPRTALRFFRWYCRKDRQEELEGDLLEMHSVRISEGQKGWLLKVLFWWDVFRCLKGYSVKKTQLTMNFSLFQSYFRLALRNAWKNKGPVSINVVGLGLAVGFMITVYTIVAYNLEFDQFYKENKDYHRLHSIRKEHSRSLRYELAPLAVAHYLNENVSAVDAVITFDDRTTTVKHNLDYFKEDIAYASENFTDHFSFSFIDGSREALKTPNTIILTRALSEKYFDDLSPIGKTLTLFVENNQKIEAIVGGVIERMPLNSSFQFDILISQKSILNATGKSISDWKESPKVGIYFKSDQPEQVMSQLETARRTHNEIDPSWYISQFDVMDFHDDRIADHLVDYSPTNMRVRPMVLVIFAFIGLMILLIACFNVANTAIALMSKRIKEIGIRKTLGSHSRQIFVQFLFEMFIITSLSFCVALLVTNEISERFFGLFGFKFLLNDVSILRFIPVVILFLVIITLLAGLLPALYAWKFQPVSILQNKYRLKGINWLHKALTVGQFTFSIAMLISAITFAHNADFMTGFDYGFNFKNILMIPVDENRDIDPLINDLAGQSYVTAISSTNHHVDFARGTARVGTDTTDNSVNKYEIAAGYLDVMDISLKEGRNFLENSKNDLENSVIVNESFVEVYFPEGNALNQNIDIEGHPRKVIGITHDIVNSVYSDYSSLLPEIFLISPDSLHKRIIVKVEGDNPEQVEREIKERWAALFDTPYKGRWQKDITTFFAVRESRNMKSIFLSLAIMGSILSLIGIFSIAALNVNRKIKEISIRKILGAPFINILTRINHSFIIILGVSLVLGVGLGFLLSDAILGTIYKFHTPVPILHSLGLGIGVTLLAAVFITIAVHKRINANPADGLRVE